jgi:hypothetical protein
MVTTSATFGLGLFAMLAALACYAASLSFFNS